MKMKRILSMMLAILMLVSVLPAEVLAVDSGTVISVGSVSAAPGATVSVDVAIENNTGILGATLKFEFDEGLTLIDAVAGDAFSYLTMTKPGKFTSPCQFIWDGLEYSADDLKDGVILTLTFQIAEDAANGTELGVTVTAPDGEIYDNDLNSVSVSTKSGVVTVVDYIPGDVNGDEKVNTADIILLRRYVVGGYDVTINTKAGNVNADGKVNSADIILLRRYVAGGYDVELLPEPGTSSHTHTMEAVAYVAPTCTTEGNIAYWQCTSCGKYFSDENGVNEITLESTVLAATGHTSVVDPAVPATTTSTGLTEGSHCSTCGQVLVAQQVIPMLEKNEYAIVYYLYAGDTYLESVGVNNPNPATYTSEDGLKLQEPTVTGYTFEGWYDGSGNSATQIKSIAAGETGTVYLYAHWSKKQYTITFDSGFGSGSDEIPSKTYTVDTGATLPSPSLGGYVFLGWTDADDESLTVISRIPSGTTGNITLTAHWTSKRNQTIPVSKIGDPLIALDSEKGQILFAYEIGVIENIPLYTLQNLACADGIITTTTQTVTKSIQKDDARTIAQTIANATTNSCSWTLSEDWNETTSVNESYAEEHGLTQEEANTFAKTSSNTYNLTSTNTESKNVSTSAGTSASLGTTLSSSKTTSDSSTHTDTKGSELDVGGNLKVGYESGKIKQLAAGKVNASLEIDVNKKWTDSSTDTTTHSETGTNSSSFSMDVSSERTVSASCDQTWSKSEGYTNSNSTSQSQTVSSAMTDMISNTYGYGNSISSGGSSSSDSATATTDSKSDAYSSTIAYSEAETTTSTTSYQTNGEKDGYYRLVLAGKAHVFAVVGYDVATRSYFTYTYSVMDDETYQFIDYSKTTASFNDEENGVLPMEIPYFVKEYVDNLIYQTEGLVVDIDTGTITGYNGDDTLIFIPDFMSVDRGDGTPISVRITGISSDAFSGNTNIKVISLSNYITEIPDNAFAGCSSLQEVWGYNVTKIGSGAFSGCSSLEGFSIPTDVTEIGARAFDGAGSISVKAADMDIAYAAIDSGAKKITLDLSEISDEAAGASLVIPEGTEYFELQGGGKTYQDLRITSDAAETVLNYFTISGCTRIPLSISSTALTLSRVTITSPGYVLLLSGGNTSISLYGNSMLTSESGNAIVCRDISLSQTNTGVETKLNVSGNIYICGAVEGSSYLKISNGELITISEEEYEKFIKGSFNVSFDANGGTVSETSITAYCGTAIGALPTPTRDNFSFGGWYTAAEGGALVTEETVLSSMEDITLYAHWIADGYTVSWEQGNGYTIAVERTDSPYAGAELGALASGDTVYYGDVLSVAYAATTGFELGDCGETEITVAGDVTGEQIYATATGVAYTVSWTDGTGYTITVNRTESPYVGAETGTLSNGATVYYGDVLSVTYAAATGYTLASSGETAITVTDNVTSSSIYATASANSYTYNIVYKSSNGTALGTATATYKYGTTNTISAPAKTGYTTPASQSVKWDSTSAKTITFTYAPSGVNTSQAMSSGNWFVWSGKYGITYSATAEYQNRTATSIQIRVKWTNTMLANSYYGYAQYFTANIGGTSSGEVQIASSSTWTSYVSYNRTATAYTGWITVPVSATQTSVSISATYRDLNSQSGSWSKTMTIPTY